MIKPTLEEVHHYMIERGQPALVEAEKYIDFYTSKGWLVGKSPMKSWKSAVNNWLRSKYGQSKSHQSSRKSPTARELLTNFDW